MKRIFIMLLNLAVIVTITACANKKDDKELNIAYFDNITHGQALIMKADNSLQEMLGDEMKVNWVSFSAGPAEVEACFSGDIDIGYIGPVPAVTANVKSEGDFVIISAATNGGSVLIARKDSGIHSVKELSGKTVAVPQLGNTQHLLLLDLLKEYHLSTVSEGGDVNVIESENADITNLINLKNVDAAFVPEPWGSTILKNTDTEIIVDYDEIQNGDAYSTAVVIVNKEYMEAHEDVVNKFLQANINATNYIQQYPEEAAEVMNGQLYEDTGKSLEEDIITEAIKKIEYTYEIPVDSIMNYAQISMDQKFISKLPEEAAFCGELLEKLEK